MVGLKCGFDQDFFQALKIKLQHKAESEKHGILIFDEIQVRKSKVVNSTTMTYTGMVNDGEDTQKSSELEDHGLVHSQSAFLHHATPPGELPCPVGATSHFTVCLAACLFMIFSHYTIYKYIKTIC